MLARLSLIALCTALVITTPMAKDKVKTDTAATDQVACSGAYGADSTEALLIETFGADNVVTGEVPGPEGSSYIGTTVFPGDPDREMVFSWFDEENRTGLSDVRLSPSQAGPGGVRIGMTVAEVAAINEEPFTIGGFWWDYGGYAGFDSGKLSGLEGDCYLSLRFSPEDDISPAIDVTPISGEVQIPSDEGLLEVVDTRVQVMSLGYASEEYAK